MKTYLNSTSLQYCISWIVPSISVLTDVRRIRVNLTTASIDTSWFGSKLNHREIVSMEELGEKDLFREEAKDKAIKSRLNIDLS